METIWAPWRSAYLQATAREEGCFICAARESGDDRQHLVLARSELSLVILNAYPYAPGHVLVAPQRHTAELDQLGDDELLDLMRWVRRVRSLLIKVAAPDGFNIGINLGRAAGAGLADHLHVHVVPRWNGDTNFMPVVNQTRVISDALLTTYDRLVAALADESEP